MVLAGCKARLRLRRELGQDFAFLLFSWRGSTDGLEIYGWNSRWTDTDRAKHRLGSFGMLRMMDRGPSSPSSASPVSFAKGALV